MKSVLAALASPLLGGAALASPNVLLIIADDFGTDASALCQPAGDGVSRAPTPNLAALASAGVLFSNAYACPVCSPTRASILTGRHAFRTGVGTVVSTAAGNSLSASEFTLPEALAAAGTGIRAAQFGKWHLYTGAASNQSPVLIGGWPYFAGSLAGGIASYTSWPKVVTDGTVAGTTTSTSTTYATTDVVNDATAWIQARRVASETWMAWVAFNAPHLPLHKPPSNLCPTYASLSGTNADINARPTDYYDAAVEAMDTEIGRLLAAVDLSTTTVIFLGDNGTPSRVLRSPFSSGHNKDTLYEGGIRVPLIIRGPTVSSPGRTDTTLVHAVDLFSTILELAGVAPQSVLPTSTRLDSLSLAPLLRGESYPRTWAFSQTFPETPTTNGRAVRDERYKLIVQADGSEELYDLPADPDELANLLAAALTSDASLHLENLRFRLASQSDTMPPLLSTQTLDTSGWTGTVSSIAGNHYTLWRTTDLTVGLWARVSGGTATGTGAPLTLSDPAPPAGGAFYSITDETP